MTKKLTMCETFYSIQGEGPTVGVPSVFLRLSGCNLTCGGLNTIKTKELDNGATWRCDTIETWLKKDKKTPEEIINSWEESGWLSHIENGAHIIITGGEPLLQDRALSEFLEYLNSQLKSSPYIEIETNGTIQPSKPLDSRVTHYNISPKLVNSGMSLEVRYKPSVLKWFSQSQKSYFKFVSDNESELNEIKRLFISPFNIKNSKIWLMPAASTRGQLIEKGRIIAEICQKEGLNMGQRLHIMLWDQTVGV